MNSYVGMTMVKKEWRQDEYFSKKAYFSQLPAYISPLISNTCKDF